MFNLKKLRFYIIMVFFLIIALSSCKKTEYIPDISEIRNISELAVLDCYYHTVARKTKPAEKNLRTPKTIWYEFTVELKLGVDTSKIQMDINETTVSIVLPPIQLIGTPSIDIESINWVQSVDGVLKTIITPEESIKLREDAKKSVVTKLYEEDPAIIKNAENRVKHILESYIIRMGELSGRKYTIEWKTIENNEIPEVKETSTDKELDKTEDGSIK